MSKLYLAYGSNLDHAQMYRRCPDAVYLGSTEVKNYRLRFRGNWRDCGVATIEPAPSENVPAGVWLISETGEASLDRYEGYPYLYHKEMLQVKLDGKTVNAMVYIMNPGHVLAMPLPDYFDTLWRGYGDCDLDREYLVKAVRKATDECFEEYYKKRT